MPGSVRRVGRTIFARMMTGYFGSVGIKKTRYAAGIGLIVDIIGVIIAILVSYMFYTVPPIK